MKVYFFVFGFLVLVATAQEVDPGVPAGTDDLRILPCAKGLCLKGGTRFTEAIFLKYFKESKYVVLSYKVKAWDGYEFCVPIKLEDVPDLVKAIRSGIKISRHADTNAYNKKVASFRAVDALGSGFKSPNLRKALNLLGERQSSKGKHSTYEIKVFTSDNEDNFDNYPLMLRWMERVILYPDRRDHAGKLNYLRIYLSAVEAENLARSLDRLKINKN